MEDSPVKVVKKALDALDILVEASLEGRGLGLSEIAQKAEIQPTTARNILKTMEQCGYVSRMDGRLYAPGHKCSGMKRAAAFTGSSMQSIESAVYNLAQSTGESIVLTSLLAGKRKVIIRVESGEIIRVDSRSIEMSAFWSLVTSRILAAYASADELQAVVEKYGLPGTGWKQIDSAGKLDSALEELRGAGYAEEDPTPESYALAVPVKDANGGLMACIGLYMPKFRLDDSRRLRFIKAMQETARYIGRVGN